MSTDARETERFTALAAQHKRADWSDRTYACAGCRLRAEDAPVPPGETPEQMRERWEKHQEILYPNWSFHDYNVHVAEHFIAAGWVSPEKHRAEVERLTKSVGAFSAARDAAKRGWQEAKDKVARAEALLAEMDSEADDYSASDATNPYDKGADDQLTTDRRRLRAALDEPERDEESDKLEHDHPCGTCIETIGYDPETPCPHCAACREAGS